MKFCFITFIILLTPICQYSFFPFLFIRHFTPDLFLIMTIYFSIIMQNYDRGYLFGFGLGLLQDLAGAGITGSNILSKGLLGLLSKTIASKFLRVNLISQLFFFFLGSFIDSALLFWITSYLLEKDLPQYIFLKTLVFKFGLNSLVGIPLISYLSKIEEALTGQKKPAYYAGARKGHS